MSRRGGGAAVRLAAAACAGAALLMPAAAAKVLAPYRVAVAVDWGSGAGSDVFRDDLRRLLAQTLATRCFAGVAITGRDAAAEDSELVFDVLLSDVLDETRFDDSIAGALEPGEPAKELRRVTYFEVTVDATLTTRASGALLNRKRFVAHVAHRPVYVGEDHQAAAHQEARDDIVRDLTRALGCGGDKLRRRIREALGDAAPAAPEPR